MKELLKNLLYNLVALKPLLRLLHARVIVPPLSSSNFFPEGIRLHLGCGSVDIQGWINVDARAFSHVHSLDLDLQLSSFSDSSVAAIYMCHVLEHFDQAGTEVILKRLRAKLAPRGKLLLSVPDFSRICNEYVSHHDISKISKPLLGGQEYEFNYHKSIFDDASLTQMLRRAGFSQCEHWDPVSIFGRHHNDYSTDPVSLNIVASA